MKLEVRVVVFAITSVVVVLPFVGSSWRDDNLAVKASPARLVAADASKKTVPPGTRARVPAGGGPLIACVDPGRLDFAFDAAKYGNTYDARMAMADTAFFMVPPPATVEVKDSEISSRWPKVLVTVLDGDSAGREGWVVLSQLPDLAPSAR